MSDRIGDWIQLYSGKQFWPLDPRPEEVDIDDIAHSSALRNRFAGHSKIPLSNAQHQVLVSRLVHSEFALQALLHDAHEVYTSDLPRPLKRGMPPQVLEWWESVVSRLDSVIFTRFGVMRSIESDKAVTKADTMALQIEASAVMSPVHPEWSAKFVLMEPHRISPLSWYAAKKVFLDRFYEITTESKL